jgi:TolB protein
MKKIAGFLFIFLFFISLLYGRDNIYLSLSSTGKKFDIGVENFTAADKNDDTLRFAKLLQETIENDFVLSRHFNVISQDIIVEDSLNTDQKLMGWVKMGATAVLSAEMEKHGEKLILDVNMLDAVSGKTIWRRKYKNELSNYRYMAHEISDEVTKKFAGEPGIARSKIAFVNNATRHKEIYIVDYDGYNLHRLTNDNKINILPKWAPDGQRIAYTSYLYNNPDLFEINVKQKSRRVISRYQGLNVASSFSPDGKYLVLTLSQGRYPNLYLINNYGDILRRMSGGYFIDTSPSFSPNGQEIVFISDRRGTPQLYIMNIYGGNVRALDTRGFCDSPAWSPRGDKIVFTMRYNENFDLYIYDLPTAKISRLTRNNRNNENPTWSPDGRFVVFYSDRSGKGEIYVMSIDGSGTRKLVEMPGSSYTPSWSPNIVQ